MALIEEPAIFRGVEGVRAGITLRGRARDAFGFNLSLSVGDEERRVLENRSRLARHLGFEPEHLATQRQVHGDRIAVVDDGYVPGETDAMTANRPGWLLGVSIADCAPVLLFDRVRRAIAAVHSGWRGTNQSITTRTIERMGELWGTRAGDLIVYIGAAAGQCCYEVGEDVAGVFDQCYCRPLGGGKYLFDNRAAILDELLRASVHAGSIELDPRCTICSPVHQSYRRDGLRSGRALAVIGLSSGVHEVEPLEGA